MESPSPWAWQSRAFFMLMACCGLRTREVRRLAVGHVDHKARSIDVVDSKAGRSRRLPVGDEVAAALRNAAGKMARKRNVKETVTRISQKIQKGIAKFQDDYLVN